MQLPHDAKYIWKQFKRELRIKLPELQSITYVYVYTLKLFVQFQF